MTPSAPSIHPIIQPGRSWELGSLKIPCLKMAEKLSHGNFYGLGRSEFLNFFLVGRPGQVGTTRGALRTHPCHPPKLLGEQGGSKLTLRDPCGSLPARDIPGPSEHFPPRKPGSSDSRNVSPPSSSSPSSSPSLIFFFFSIFNLALLIPGRGGINNLPPLSLPPLPAHFPWINIPELVCTAACGFSAPWLQRC